MLNIKKTRAKLVNNNKLSVVHDDDLEVLLKSLNVYESVLNKEKRCLFCNSLITIDNIDSIVPQDGKVEFTCDDIKCHGKLIGLR